MLVTAFEGLALWSYSGMTEQMKFFKHRRQRTCIRMLPQLYAREEFSLPFDLFLPFFSLTLSRLREGSGGCPELLLTAGTA